MELSSVNTGTETLNVKLVNLVMFLFTFVVLMENGEIPKGMQVNHIDENKLNNALSNLNLMTPKENCNWGTRNERLSKSKINNPKFSKPLAKINLETSEVVATFPSIREVERQFGYDHTTIYRCCNGGFYRKGKWINITQAYDFGWKFID